MLELRCPSCAGALAAEAEDRKGCRPCGRSYRREEGIWRLAGGFSPEGFPRPRVEGLARLDEGHFWAEPRDALAERLLQEALPPGPVAALELGCGTGRFLSRLGARGLAVCGVDGHLELLDVASRRREGVELVHADTSGLPLASEQFDVVAALDVLEHVEPGPFLAEVARVLRPDGTFLVSVPASPALWSRLDEAAGHRCRYTLPALRADLEAAGLQLTRWTHYQMLLFPLVLASRLLGRRHEVAAERRPPAWLGRLLGWVNRMEVRVLGGLSLPFGSSLLGRAVRWA